MRPSGTEKGTFCRVRLLLDVWFAAWPVVSTGIIFWFLKYSVTVWVHPEMDVLGLPFPWSVGSAWVMMCLFLWPTLGGVSAGLRAVRTGIRQGLWTSLFFIVPVGPSLFWFLVARRELLNWQQRMGRQEGQHCP